MTTPARSVFPILSTEDLGVSMGFYGLLLGGEESYRFPNDGQPSFVVLRLGESEIGLAAIGDTLHGEPMRPASGHRFELCVYVEDVDAAVTAAREAGMRIVAEPSDQVWGERVAYVADPDGNLVMLTA